MGTEPLRIDIEKALNDKRKSTSRPLPKFIINFLKRIVHENEINDFLSKHGDKVGMDFADAAIEYLGLKVELKGTENIPNEGMFTFASNHPIGGLDGLAAIRYLGTKYNKDIKVLANDLLMNITNLHPFFLPVNKHGNQAKESAIMINKMYHSSSQILIFPAGLVSRRVKGKIIDLDWKKSFVTKSIHGKRDIIPLHISGRVTNFFYNLASLRVFLGIKTNLEMLFLPREMFKLRNKTLTLTFGKPIPYASLDRSKNAKAWADEIKKEVYKLA